ncbi:MAG: hypothetical protein GXY85_07340 [Candidatus Brocadiaceae bacterium]|nr:hypothetical protein [Candidatus Brocadiaceae bacterium]
MIRKGRLIAAAFLLFVLQATLAHRFGYGALRLDLLAALAAFLALEAAPRPALAGAALAGLLTDLGSAGPLGVSSLLLMAVTGGVLALRGPLLRETPWVDLLLTLLFLLAYGLLAAAAAWLQHPGANIACLAARGAAPAAFTTAVAPLLFAGLSKAGIVPSHSDA